jgi:alpha-tubulin suppressor-like RCC1 family protein
MNIIKIIENISNKISSIDSEQNILYLSKIIEKLDVGSVKYLATYNDMLDENTSDGTLYFIEDENSLYYSIFKRRILIYSPDSPTFSWGNNSTGMLGDASSTTRSSPVSVVGGFTNWIEVSAGCFHNLGLRANGTAWAWGANTYGRLGDNTTTSRLSPVSVVGGFTDWVQLSASIGTTSTNNAHSLGLRANGTIWGWGLNSSGQIGDETITSRLSPVSVVGGFTDWVQVSAGGMHSLGLRSNGTAWAWGRNFYGNLGDNSITSKSSPVSVVGDFTDWTQLSAGSSHSLGLRANGTAWAWGANINGRLGDNSTTSRSSPVSVVGGFSDWIQVSASEHSLGLRSNGTAWAWGPNTYGRLGDNSLTSRSSPVSVVGGFSDWVQLSAGGSHSLAIRADGTAWAWGRNLTGALGDNSLTNRSSPVSVVGGFTDWVQVSGGAFHSLGIRTLI